MDRLARGYDARLRRLNKAIPPIPPTPEELTRVDARRMELCAAALADRDESDLNLDEREQKLYARIRQHAPVLQELLAEGIVTASGQPGGADLPEDDHESRNDIVMNGHDDDDGYEEFVWGAYR